MLVSSLYITIQLVIQSLSLDSPTLQISWLTSESGQMNVFEVLISSDSENDTIKLL